MNNKDLIKKASSILEEQGHKISTGHLYELFSKLSGFADWNRAKASDAKFASALILSRQEEEIVEHLIERIESNESRIKELTSISFEFESRAWVKFKVDYTLKKNTKVNEALIEEFKTKFLNDVERLEMMAPYERNHIEMEVVTAQGYVDIDPKDIEVEITTPEDRAVEPFSYYIPDLEDYAKIAEGFKLRRDKIANGLVKIGDDGSITGISILPSKS